MCDPINDYNECIVIDGRWDNGYWTEESSISFYTAEAEMLLPNACYLQAVGLDADRTKRVLSKSIRNLGFTGEIVYG